MVLTWTFPSPQAVDSILVGARTTIARWPTSLQLQGGDNTTGTGPSPEYTEKQFYGLGRFVSATKTAILRSYVPRPNVAFASRDLLLAEGFTVAGEGVRSGRFGVVDKSGANQSRDQDEA